MDQALNAIDPSKIRNAVQMFWDPEPSNDASRNLPAWCLGHSYKLGPRPNNGKPVGNRTPNTKPDPIATLAADSGQKQGIKNTVSSDAENATPPSSLTTSTSTRAAPASPTTTQRPDTPPDSVSSSFDSSLAYEEFPNRENGGWPAAFLDDVESRLWMTYRSDFELIPRSQDPDATRALSFAMRLRTQFSDQLGFSSDTGWGCMIRTGQCLLANTKCFLDLGRDWRRSRGGEGSILAQFSDDPRAPYSIHNFVRHGSQACGKYPGEWFGPSATARCIQYGNVSFLRLRALTD